MCSTSTTEREHSTRCVAPSRGPTALRSAPFGRAASAGSYTPEQFCATARSSARPRAIRKTPDRCDRVDRARRAHVPAPISAVSFRPVRLNRVAQRVRTNCDDYCADSATSKTVRVGTPWAPWTMIPSMAPVADSGVLLTSQPPGPRMRRVAGRGDQARIGAWGASGSSR